jgi:hypothetical protein
VVSRAIQKTDDIEEIMLRAGQHFGANLPGGFIPATLHRAENTDTLSD